MDATCWRTGTDDPPPGGILFEFRPAFPAAHEAFTPAELEARIRLIRQKKMVNFRRHEGVRCWACPRRCSNGRKAVARGWKCRPMPLNESVDEVLCPACWKKWGWLDEFAAPAGHKWLHPRHRRDEPDGKRKGRKAGKNGLP